MNTIQQINAFFIRLLYIHDPSTYSYLLVELRILNFGSSHKSHSQNVSMYHESVP